MHISILNLQSIISNSVYTSSCIRSTWESTECCESLKLRFLQGLSSHSSKNVVNLDLNSLYRSFIAFI